MDYFNVLAVVALGGDDRVVAEEDSAGLEAALELFERSGVHDDRVLGIIDQRAGDEFLGEDYGAFAFASAHGGRVVGEVRNIVEYFDAGVGEDSAECQDPLAAEPRHGHFEVFVSHYVFSPDAEGAAFKRPHA